MKKLFTVGILMSLSISAFAQQAGDISRLERQQNSLVKNVEATEAFLNEDRSIKFTCHADYQAPFEELQKVTMEKTAATKESIATQFKAILEGNGKNGLKAMVTEIEARKAEIKAEKNKIRKKELKKVLKSKVQQAQELAQIARNTLAPSYKETIQSLITVDGAIQMAMSEDTSDLQVKNIFKTKENVNVASGMSPAEIYNQKLNKLLNSCETKDCVYLISAEIKNILSLSFKANQSIKIISGVVVKKSKSFSKKQIFSKLDEVVAEVAKRKPLADLDPSCFPAPSKPGKGDDKPAPVKPDAEEDGTEE